jgi:hypothetical protein
MAVGLRSIRGALAAAGVGSGRYLPHFLIDALIGGV